MYMFVSDELKLEEFVSEELKLEKWSSSSHGICLYEESALSSQSTGYLWMETSCEMLLFVFVEEL